MQARRRGMTTVEAVASLTLTAALGIAVAQTAAVSARLRGTVQRRAVAMLAAGNTLEILRAADPASLDEFAAELTGEVVGLPGAQREITLTETQLGGIPAREIRVTIRERPADSEKPSSAPLVLVGWRLSATGQAENESQSETEGDPAGQGESDAP